MFREEVKQAMLAHPHWIERGTELAMHAYNIFSQHKSVSGNLLDIGCANGRDAAFFSSKGLKVRGIDINRDAINEAHRKYKNIKFVVGNAEFIPFEDNYFDFVYCTNTIMWTDENKSVPEIFRVLKSQGMFFLHIDTQVDNLDTNEVEHKILKETIMNLLGEVILTSEATLERIDPVPFKHSHIILELTGFKK
ncbi:class I SAM-dependent methyltransferase [Fischerella sp. PCC 9605]|uniref:class I SAM-dependent methyltransferase n=1 Tax=Fischerella sp. PCC 9605 TaxID=1173024 RepID=UPI00047B4CBB|nr:class I SAM-dependent methyltransferase [Fischerella sp. PCC 9605]